MAAKRTMLWLLVWRALRLRFQRVSVVFAALMVGATIVTALSAVWFDINTKMSEELRTFGANFYIGPGHGSSMPQQELQSILDQAPQGLVHGASPWLYGMARTELEKVVMVGVWFESLQKMVPYWQVTGSWIGVSFDDRNAMIGVKLAERLNVQPGDSITLVDHNQRKNLQIKGIVESGDATDNMLIVSLDVAQAWLHQPGKISHGLLSVSNDVGQVENYASRLQAQYPDLEIRPVRKVSASEGQVFLDGTDAAALDEEGRRRFRAEKIGLVFQQFHLIPFLTALENIMLAQHYHSVVDEAAARKVLEQVGLGHRVTHLPSQLSGGEQQRVCIARALVNEPPVIFADEPTGNLDEENEQRVLDLLTDLHRQGRTIVMVTHNPALGQFADRILRLQHGKYLGEEANQHALA